VVWSLLGEKRTSRDHRKSVGPDPKRHFATTNYRIAKSMFDHAIGDREQQWREASSPEL
jgi:hypothetical protein